MLFFTEISGGFQLMEETGTGERKMIAFARNSSDGAVVEWKVTDAAKMPNEAAKIFFSQLVRSAYSSMQALGLSMCIMRDPSMLTNKD